jgi:hypothetical protein
VAIISIPFRVGTLTSSKWISVPCKLLKNLTPMFCCPLFELSYVLLNSDKISLLGEEYPF